jgi:DNA-directed RNA polymerase specialized sigma subunit
MAERKKYTITMYREKTGAKAPQALLDLRRTQLEVSAKFTKALGAGPKTVPEVATATGLPTREVLWYMMTYYKYGLVSVAGKTEDGYYRYALKERKK